MKIKTAEASGEVLEWLMAKAEGMDYQPNATYDGIGNEHPPLRYMNSPEGMEVIDREGISLIRISDEYVHLGSSENPRAHVFQKRWAAAYGDNPRTSTTESERHEPMHQIYVRDIAGYGESPMLAGLRCYLTHKLGKETDIPDELLETRLVATQERPRG